jgi:hypothetical protein
MNQFEEIKKLVLAGVPVYKALRKHKISSATFYRNITDEQQNELRSIKISFAKYGNGKK